MRSAFLADRGLRASVAAALFAVALGVLAREAPSAPGDPIASLGSMLFADKRLSVDGTISCASCHEPSKAFADGRAVSIGIKGQQGTRNALSLLNVREHDTFFWDGRRATLEAQVMDPFTNAREHGWESLDDLLARLKEIPEYRAAFAKSFGSEEPDQKRVAAALTAFVRSIETPSSRFDRWQGGDRKALSQQERHGLEIFQGPGQCASCHSMGDARASFTDNKFHSVGVGGVKLADTVAGAAKAVMTAKAGDLPALITAEPSIAALGRFNVTRKLADIGKYRTPSLRNVARTAPYMHDGSIPTLEEAVEQELYYRSAQQGRPLVLTVQEKADLVAFLRSLSSESLEIPKGSQ